MADQGYQKNDPSFSTRSIHIGNEPEQWNYKALVPPIFMSTTFKQDAPAEFKKYEYGRLGNPTRDCLEKCLASLENAQHGLVFSSGMASIGTVMNLLVQGDHMITQNYIYGGTHTYFGSIASRMGIEISYIDDVNVKAFENAIKPNTKMIWLETPSNPTLRIVDIAAFAEMSKKHKDIVTVVDNTFMSAYFQRPLTLGADLVLHSCTKYMNGHSDVIMGAVCTNRKDLHDRLHFLQKSVGSVPSPFDCYLVSRALKTLALRMEQHMKNGMAVAKFLDTHPCIEEVIHPSLPSHPQHNLAKRQCYGHSGMVTFYIKGNNLKVAKEFLKNLKVITLANSLGGCESICEHPALQSYGEVSQNIKDKLGITDGLIRLSCGLEYSNDIIQDLDQALKAAVPH